MRKLAGAASVAVLALTVAVRASSASAGPSGGALPPQLVQVIDPSELGVPTDAEMVAANITAVTPLGPGHLVVYPCDEDLPPTSNLNYVADSIVPNLVFARLAADGTFCIATWDVTDVVVDLIGYVPAGSALEALANPQRALDTRDGSQGATPIPAGRTVVVPIAGRFGVAPDATLAVVNLTAVGASAPGYLTMYPCDGGIPPTSSVNFVAGATVANAGLTRLATDGTLCIDTSAAADIVVDIAAYQPTASGIHPLATPQRIVDTRLSPGAAQRANGTLTVPIAARPDVPDDAGAAIYNLTSDQAGAAGYATSYPCGTGAPLASNLNYVAARPVANSTITKLSADGTLCVFTSQPTHLVVDLVGYVEGAADYEPITPVRALDTREGWQSQCDWVFEERIDPFVPERRLELYNLATKARVDVHRASPMMTTFIAGVALSSTCDSILEVVSDGSTPQGVYEIGFDGTRELVSLNHGNGDVGAIRQLDDGTIVVFEAARFYDVLTGALLDEAIRQPTDWLETVLSASGVAAILHGERSGGAAITVRDIRTHQTYGTIPVVDGDELSISPNGDYVAVRVQIDQLTTSVEVYTRFGELVDRYRTQTGALFHPLFIGNGQLLLCGYSYGLYSWELFGPVSNLRVRGWGSEPGGCHNPSN